MRAHDVHDMTFEKIPNPKTRGPITLDDWARRRFFLKKYFSVCPFVGIGNGDVGYPHGGEAATVIYRMSTSAVTMRCKECDLQWSMTFHRISGTLTRWADAARAKGYVGDANDFDTLAELFVPPQV